MFSLEYLENMPYIELNIMLRNGEILEWLIPDEWWGEIGLAWAEYQAETSYGLY
ncbi:hypothetical protein CAL7716_065500 [Calothrix sp. PCC 7716]|nr:hypothetical protein CAL7716_065500 [Calothrix sp. PCC 7716]